MFTEIPVSFLEFNIRKNVEKTRSREFFKKGSYELQMHYPQNVLVYPNNPNLFSELISKLNVISGTDENKCLWIPKQESFHITVHCVYFNKQGSKIENLFFKDGLREIFGDKIKEYFKKPMKIRFENLILTQDGSLILCGIFVNKNGSIDYEGNKNIQELRKELKDIQRSKGRMDIIHISLGRLVPNWDKPSFLIKEEKFKVLKEIIDEYNTRPADKKLTLEFDRLAFVKSKSTVYENPQWVEDVIFAKSA
jgi:hypothetical protein